MKIRDIGEFGLIGRLRSRYSKPYTLHPNPCFLGIGDDTAVIDNGKKYILWTTDVLIEGIHFFPPSLLSTVHSPQSTAYMLGWKAMAVNLSDIASMGGIPKYAVVTLGLTGKEDIKFIDELYRGMDAVAKYVKIVGGDTSRSPVLMINISVLGEVEKKNLLLRKGAKPGDVICVTGTCGDSAAGFEMIKKSFKFQVSNFKQKKNSQLTTHNSQRLILKHMMPTPRLKEGRIIAKNHLATAMIDNSDGLLLSIKFICQPSGVGARIFEDKVPISSQLKNVAVAFMRHSSGSMLHRTANRKALSGGEDYELVFTVPPSRLKEVINKVNKSTGQQVTAIGEITKNKEICVVDHKGRSKSLSGLGFDHFK